MSNRMRPLQLVIAGLLAACSSGETPAIDTATPVSRPSPPAAVASAPDSAAGRTASDCPATGKWALCSFEKRLRRSGFVATKIDSASPNRAGFSVQPAVYKLGGGRLEVFLYEDAAAMERDIAGIDTLTVSPPGTPPAWPSGAALVRNGNVAAVYMGQSAREAERLTLAITAGAPSGS